MPTWYARIDWTSPDTTTPDQSFAAMDELTDHAPAATVTPDGHGGSVRIAVDAPSFDDALTLALDTARPALTAHVPGATVTGLELLTEDAMDRELERPLFPEVVGFAEIAELAGVSRQRARAFRTSPGFPVPVIQTAHGPLMAKAAVEQWIATRNTRPGRRTATA